MLVAAIIVPGQTLETHIPLIHKAVRKRLEAAYTSANDANGAAGLAAIATMSDAEVYAWVEANWSAQGMTPVEINPVPVPEVPAAPAVPQVPTTPQVANDDSGFQVEAPPSDDPDEVVESAMVDTGTLATEPAAGIQEPEVETPAAGIQEPAVDGQADYTGHTKVGKSSSLKGQVLAVMRGNRTADHTGQSIADVLNDGKAEPDFVKVTTINSTLSALKAQAMVIALGKVDGAQAFRAVEALPKITDPTMMGNAVLAALESGKELNLVVGDGLVTFTPWSL